MSARDELAPMLPLVAIIAADLLSGENDNSSVSGNPFIIAEKIAKWLSAPEQIERMCKAFSEDGDHWGVPWAERDTTAQCVIRSGMRAAIASLGEKT